MFTTDNGEVKSYIQYYNYGQTESTSSVVTTSDAAEAASRTPVANKMTTTKTTMAIITLGRIERILHLQAMEPKRLAKSNSPASL